MKFSVSGKEPDNSKQSIKLVSVNSDVQQLKVGLLMGLCAYYVSQCMAWRSGQSDDPNLIAAGLQNGKVVLTSFSSVNRIWKEFVPRHRYVCLLFCEACGVVCGVL